MISKGDRIAMNSSVETRYPFLDDDVIAFCAEIAPEYKLHGMTDKWLLRQVAAQDAAAADRQPPQDDVPRQPGEDVPRPDAPGLGRSAPQPRIAPRDGLLRPRGSSPGAAALRVPLPRISAQRLGLDLGLTVRDRDPALAPHLLRRRPLRPADLDPSRLVHPGRPAPAGLSPALGLHTTPAA